MSDEVDWPAFEKWLETRPQEIKDMARRVPPASWWRLPSDGDPEASVYQLYSWSEGGTVTLTRYNVASKEPMWNVFGIEPDKLVPADSLDVLHARLNLTPQAVDVARELARGHREYLESIAALRNLLEIDDDQEEEDA